MPVKTPEYPSPVEASDYIVFKDGDIIKAKNGKTGQIEFKGRSASTVIQSTINALTSGGKIFIKPGTYYITSTLSVSNSDIELTGEFYTTILQASSLAGNVLTVTGSGFHLSNITIDGTGQTSGHGIELTGGRGYLHHFEVRDCYADGIHLGHSSWVGVVGAKVHHFRSSSNGGNGLYLDYDATDCEITDGLIHSHSGTGDAGIVFDACNCRLSSIHLWGNYYNLKIAPAHLVTGLVCTNMGFMDNLNHNVFKDSTYTFRNSAFVGCFFWGKLTSGSAVRDTFYVSSSGTMRTVTVTGCDFRGINDEGTKQARYAVNWGSNVTYCVFLGNTVEGFTEASPINIADTTTNKVGYNTEYNNGS